MPKQIRQYLHLSTAPVESHARAVVRRASRYHSLADFEPSAFWAWIRSYLRALFGRKYPFPSAGAGIGHSRYRLPDEVKIALAGDWGTGTDEAAAVAAQMMRWPGGGEPDLTIHLGDIYYVGEETEVRENCLGGAGLRHRHPLGVRWPAGRLGSFALNGNHEMYSRGHGYFKVFLPTLGMRDRNGNLPGQGVSYFCLENEHWRIIGLDTGYNSDGPPLLALWIDGSCALEPALLSWLRETIPTHAPRKATILLSHHQYYSGFDREYPVPPRQLEEFFPDPVLWLWGHEHRLAGYKLFGTGALQAHGRCLGHGGMPVEQKKPLPGRPAARHLLFNDARINPLFPRDHLGFNGFARMHLHGPELWLDYCTLAVCKDTAGATYLDEPTLLLSESFRAESGKIIGPQVTFHGREPGFALL